MRWRRPAGLALIATALAATWFHVRGIAVDIPIAPAAVQHDGGHGYAVALPRLRLFFLERDTERTPRGSSARLLEDGVASALPHTVHDEIRAQGGGRFSHWNRTLHFSASDNTDPRSNGRRYVLATTQHLHRWLFHVALILGLAGFALVLPAAARRWPAAVSRFARGLLPAALRQGGRLAPVFRVLRRAAPVFAQLGLAVATLLLALGVGELYLRLTLPFTRSEVRLRNVPDVGVTYVPGSRARWTNLVDFWADEPVNSQGFVEVEPQPRQREDECRIAFVGDSFVEAIQVPIADKVQHRLAGLLRGALPGRAFAVHGFGYSGTGQAAQLAYYEHFVRPWQPDLVVLVMVSNDLSNNSPVLEAVRNGWHPEHPGFHEFMEDAGAIRTIAPDMRWVERMLPVRLPRPRALHLWLEDRLVAYRWLMAHGAVLYPQVAAAWVRGPTASELFLGRLDALRRETRYGGGFDGWAYPDDLDIDNMFFADTMPAAFEQAVRLTNHAMREWRRRADRDGARLLGLTTHEMVRPMPPVQFGRRTDPDRYRQRMVAAAGQAGFEVVNQYAFAQGQGRDLATLAYRRDGHWTPLGHQVAAEAVFDHLRRHPELCGPRARAP